MEHKLQSASAGAHQRGQATLITVLLVLGVAATALVYTMVSPAKTAIESENKTAAALARARDALIGYAARNTTQPGILPCPDSDNDGDADSPCGATGVTAIGRLPWKTLGLPDLRDGSGECLWYAVSANFKNSGASGPSWLNSDSPGTLVVSDHNGTQLFPAMATTVAAIILAPGTTLSGQDRSPSSTTVCGGNTNATNYLDTYTVGATTFNNATGGGTNSFITASPLTQSDQLNDRLLPLTTDALFSVVEMRVLRETRSALRTYRTNNGYFPSANAYTDATYNCSYFQFQGRIPLNINITCTAFQNWGAELPAWFAANKWQEVTYYAVSPCRVGAIGALQFILDIFCSGLGDVTVDSNPSVHAVVFTTGRALSGQTRPSTLVTDYLDIVQPGNSNENQDLDDVFISPVRSGTNNDRLLIAWP
ncbi:MAG: hypothetical protein HYY78_06550 [Betaproteobacteria bacterium]|nr:hypothetical protein [Betaproteobacteria bacterium]